MRKRPAGISTFSNVKAAFADVDEENTFETFETVDAAVREYIVRMRPLIGDEATFRYGASWQAWNSAIAHILVGATISAKVSAEGLIHHATSGAMESLKAMGVNMVSLASNHSFDLGEEGVFSTITGARRAGFAHSGTEDGVFYPHGAPRLATGAQAKEILQLFAAQSRGFGTGIQITGRPRE